jgi:hypothetical protein
MLYPIRMKCPKCGYENKEDALYCNSCQHRLREVEIIEGSPPQDFKPLVQPPHKTKAVNNEEEQQLPESEYFYYREFVKRHSYLLLFLVLAITFFSRNNFKGVQNIAPEVLNPPLQRKIDFADIIRFKRNGYAYELSPLYDYEINALVVSKMNYKMFSIEKFEKVFPYDLCLIWGSNVSSGLYRNTTLKFSQDCRFCWAQWQGDVNFHWDEISNNHLLIDNSQLESKVRSLVIGDQVKIRGKLVNIKAGILGKPDAYDSSQYSWSTSVTRKDNGAGACEVIYVEDVSVLRRANVISNFLFHLSLYSLLVLAVWKLLRFFSIF